MATRQHFARLTRARVLAAICSVTLLSGCDKWGPHESVVSPSDDPTLTATIGAPIVPFDGSSRSMTPLIPFNCSKELQFTGPLDIAMTAGRDVDVDQVEVRLVDDSIIRSAVNTFSHDDLTESFGSTEIPAGTVRIFRFRTKLPCPRQPPLSVAADIRFRESSGRHNSITATAPFDVTVVVNR